jgi:hypothetical protein
MQIIYPLAILNLLCLKSALILKAFSGCVNVK